VVYCDLLAGFTAAYDQSSNRTFERHLHAECRSFSFYVPPVHQPTPASAYDSACRLVQYNRGILANDGGSSITLSLSLPGVDSQRIYTLDATGNWVDGGVWGTSAPALQFTHDCASTSQSRTANSLNQIATIDGSSVSYDVKGNLSSYGGLSFTYDAFNRLLGVTGTGPSGSSVNMSYTYDALGRRVLSNPNSLSSLNTYFIYDGSQVIEEYSGSDLTSLRRQYVWGQYVDELVQQREYQRPTNGATYEDLYPLTNLNYSAVALSRQNPCGTGSSAGGGGPSSSGPANPFAEVYDTDPYGRTRIYSGPGPDGKWFSDDDVQTYGPIGRYIYTGREYDAETGLYYYRARHYHPDLGRFLSRDPIGYAGGMNLYLYCNGNPLVGTDAGGTGPVANFGRRGNRSIGHTVETDVGAPGTLESFIPVWGSGREAIHDFQTGHWGWGIFNTAMAISDLFLFKALLTAGGKLVIKGGAMLLAKGLAARGAEAAITTVAKASAEVATEGLVRTAGREATETAASTGRRLFVHLSEENYADVVKKGTLGRGFIGGLKDEGRVWATTYTRKELEESLLRRTSIGLTGGSIGAQTIEITGDAAKAFSRPFGPRFSLNPLGWLKILGEQYQFRGTLRYVGGNVVSTLEGATRYGAAQMLYYRAHELARFGLYIRIPSGIFERYGRYQAEASGDTEW